MDTLGAKILSFVEICREVVTGLFQRLKNTTTISLVPIRNVSIVAGEVVPFSEGPLSEVPL